jgi:hypothetical protein
MLFKIHSSRTPIPLPWQNLPECVCSSLDEIFRTEIVPAASPPPLASPLPWEHRGPGYTYTQVYRSICRPITRGHPSPPPPFQVWAGTGGGGVFFAVFYTFSIFLGGSKTLSCRRSNLYIPHSTATCNVRAGLQCKCTCI